MIELSISILGLSLAFGLAGIAYQLRRIADALEKRKRNLEGAPYTHIEPDELIRG